MTKIKKINCKYCGKEIEKTVHNKIYCNKRCAKRQWRIDNREHCLKSERELYYKNKDKRKESSRRWYHKNKEKFKTKEWKEKRAQYHLERYYNLKKDINEYEKVLARHNDRKKKAESCLICRSNENLHFHHTDYKNRMGCTLCIKCHFKQHGGVYV